jgi:hypothetical protein
MYLLINSSLSFLLSSFYAYYNKLYFISVVIFITSVISSLYWSNTENKLYYICDIVCSRLLFTFMFINGMLHYDFSNYSELLFSLLILSLLVNSFIGSHYLFNNNNDYWVYYHFLFHINATILLLLVIKNIIRQRYSSI